MSAPVKYLRKVIRIKASDSPNVQVAEARRAKGLSPIAVEVLPGVISWDTYQQRRRTWDKVRQCVGLDGMFYEGGENLIAPPDWLNKAEEYARSANLRGQKGASAIGIDTAEGGDNTAFAVLSEQGLIKLISKKTTNTAVITGEAIALMKEFGVKPKMVMFDQGGGGKEHADRLWMQGYPVRYVSFGEAASPEPVRFMKTFDSKNEERRERFNFKNRRAQMYWMLHQKLDPDNQLVPFGIPDEYVELRRQLSQIPFHYDEEGKIFLPPKRRKPGTQVTSASVQTLEEILGCSPDEADALVLAVFAMDPGSTPVTLKSIL